MTSSNNKDRAQKAALIAELQQAGIKHTPENIIRIAKTAEDQIVFLETGNLKAGLQHILEEHTRQFGDKGISSEQIPDARMTAVTTGKIVGYQGENNPRPRPIYQFTFNGEIKYLAVQVSENGYIVSANPKRSS